MLGKRILQSKIPQFQKGNGANLKQIWDSKLRVLNISVIEWMNKEPTNESEGQLELISVALLYLPNLPRKRILGRAELGAWLLLMNQQTQRLGSPLPVLPRLTFPADPR